MTLYRLPISDPCCEFCGVDQKGNFYCHPNAFDPPLLQKAKQARVIIFVRIPDGIVPLVPLSWIGELFADNDEQLGYLETLRSAFRGFINAGAKSHQYPLADVSLPGEPAFTDAVLRTLAGDRN